MLEVISSLVHFPEGLLIDLGLILIVAAFAGFFARLIRQPLIPSYIIAGLVLGPVGLAIIQDVEIINIISEIGIMFLLFIVGMEMDLKKLKKVGWVTVITGICQVLFTFTAGYFIGLGLGFNTLNAIYTGLIIAFSSTMVVIKLLSDVNKLNTLHGRLIIGVLFMQDVLVILALTIFVGTSTFTITSILPLLLKFLLLVLFGFLVNKFLAARVFRFSAKSSELLFLMAIAFCFTFALAAYLLGYSVAMGAFLGGLVIASLPYNTSIVGRIKPLKDFFAIIFFVALGLQLTVVNFGAIWQPFIILFLVVLLLKPLIIMTILSIFGFDKRNAFASAVSLGQISEFSLILAISVSNISQELFSITILLAIATIASTSYILKYELTLYNWLIPVLKYFEKLSKRHRKLGYDRAQEKNIILAGANNMGGMFLRAFDKLKKHILVVDFNPEIVEELRKRKLSSMYGDITNKEVLRRINFTKAKVFISTVRTLEDNLIVLKYLKTVKGKPITFIAGDTIQDALELYDAGADYVMIPSVMSGEQVAQLIEKNIRDVKKLKKIKRQHLKHLLEMNEER